MSRITSEMRGEIIKRFKTGKYTLLEIAHFVGVSEASVSYTITNYFKKNKSK